MVGLLVRDIQCSTYSLIDVEKRFIRMYNRNQPLFAIKIPKAVSRLAQNLGCCFDHCMIPICEVGMEHDHDNPQQGRIKTFDRMYAFATQHVQAYGPC